MAVALPEDTWIYVLIMAIIILALLWNDKISSGSSSSSSSTSTSSPESSGTDDSGTGDDGGSGSTDSAMDPVVRVEENIDHRNGRFQLKAEARSQSSADIVATGFVKMSHYPTGKKLIDVDSPENSEYVRRGSEYEIEESGIAPGVIRYEAWTKDSNGRTGTYINDFEIEPLDDSPESTGPDIDIEYGDGPEGPDGPGGDPPETDIPDLILEYLSDMIKFKEYTVRKVDSGVKASDKLLYGFCHSYYSGNDLNLSHKPVKIMEAMKELSINFSTVKAEINNLENRPIREKLGHLGINSKNDLLEELRNIEAVFTECNIEIRAEDLPEL